MIDFERDIEKCEIPPYKKKAKKKPRHKKLDHKHHPENCVFEYNALRFSKTNGMVWDRKRFSVGKYCPICGKIISLFDDSWFVPEKQRGKDSDVWFAFDCAPWSEKALAEFYEETRTLPKFKLDDWFQKYIDLEQ